jgi:hypothetical protein
MVTMVVTTIGPANIATSVSIFSAGRLEAGRGKPFTYMSGGLSLTGLSQKIVSVLTRGFGLRFLSKSLGFLCQPIRKRQGVFETTSLHGAAPIRVKAGARLVSQSPIKAKDRAVMVLTVRSPNGDRWSKLTTGGTA